MKSLFRPLQEGETVTAYAKFHRIKYTWAVLMVAFALSIFVINHLTDPYSLRGIDYMIIPQILFLICFPLMMIAVNARCVTLTNQRLLAKRGLFNCESMDLALSEVVSVSVAPVAPVFRLFHVNAGTLVINGPEGTQMQMPYVKDAKAFVKAYNAAKAGTASAMNTARQPVLTRQSNGYGVASLWIAILTVILLLVKNFHSPIVTMYWIVGLLLSIIGMFKAPRWPAIAGLCTSIGIILFIAILYGFLIFLFHVY